MLPTNVQNELARLSNRGDDVSELLSDALRETLEDDATPEERGWIDEVESLRARLRSSSTEISITDYGAGSRDRRLTSEEMYRGRVFSKTIGQVAQRTSKPYRWSLLLFKLVRKFEPSVCLELGTSLGISTAYQAAGLKLNREGGIVTLEGAESSAALARENFQGLDLDNVTTVVGRFQDTLDGVLDRYGPIDLAFIDGHHDEQATLAYFEQIYPSLSERAVLVFDDISWSEGMERAWSAIEADTRVELSVGLSQLGICFLDSGAGQRESLDLGHVGRSLKDRGPARAEPGPERGESVAARLEETRAELEKLKSLHAKSEREKEFFKREYLSIMESRFWRYTEPVRRLLGEVRRVASRYANRRDPVEPERPAAREAPEKAANGGKEAPGRASRGHEAGAAAVRSGDPGQSKAGPARSRDLRQRRLRQHNLTVGRIKGRLYGLGFTDRASEELRLLAADEARPALRKLAAWELALWHANQYSEEGAQQCLELLPVALQGETDQRALRRASIIEAECHEALGDVEAARGALSRRLESEADADLFLARANLEASPAARVEWINSALRLHGVSPISYDASTGHPLLDSLRPGLDGREQGGAPGGTRVSVIMPVYNSESVVRTALESVLSQTWTDLEVLVVDDCSTDATVSVVEEYVEMDPRVHLIKAEANRGTYAARNLALRVATGELVTCHDADDWSHPEKIEIQVQHLLENPPVMGNMSQQARATEDLGCHRLGRPGYIGSNLPSLMFRREPVMEAVGYWDRVRFGADNEFIRRIQKVFGDESVVTMPTGPLCFQRKAGSSLTGNEAFGFHGYYMGARREYFQAQGHFHDAAESLRYEFAQGDRPFAVPEPMWPVREAEGAERRHFDVVLVSDFRLPGGSTLSSVEEIKAQKRMGLRTGLVQMYRYDVSHSAGINPEVRELLDGDLVQMLVYGEEVSCDVLVLRYPPVLQERQRFVPDVEAKDVHVIVNQTPMRGYGEGAELAYTIGRCEEHLREYFGKAGLWHPIGPLAREALHRHHAAELEQITLADEDWPNIIDVEEWRRESRPPRGERPRIGRHATDRYVKWPADREELLAAYPGSGEYEVHVLGGARVPERLLGGLPESWRVLEFGEVHPKDFLSTLDVFVYYTHPDWVESFGRVILEAMAVGVPVILPPGYREVFGEAAVYAEPPEVTQHVDRLMGDDDYYDSQVKTARGYVERHFGYTQHAARLGRYLGTGSAASSPRP